MVFLMFFPLPMCLYEGLISSDSGPVLSLSRFIRTVIETSPESQSCRPEFQQISDLEAIIKSQPDMCNQNNIYEVSLIQQAIKQQNL